MEQWVCIKAPNVLIYTIPFNKGSCFFASKNSLPQNSFVPDEEQLACAESESDEIGANNARLPAGTRVNYGYNRWKQEQRYQLHLAATVFKTVGIGILLRAGPIPLSGVRGSLVSEGLTGGIQGVANAFQPAGNFPTCADATGTATLFQNLAGAVDNNYQVITPPQPLPPKIFSATGGLTPQEVNAVNALLANQAQTVGYLRALGTALRKADLAADAGAFSWEKRQLEAAGQFSKQAASLVEAQIGLYAALAQAYTAAGHVYNIPLQEQDVRAFQSSLRAENTQNQLRQDLGDLGATQQEQDLVILTAYRVYSGDVVAMGGGKIPDIFVDPKLTHALQQLAEVLRQGPVGSTAGNVSYLPLVVK